MHIDAGDAVVVRHSQEEGTSFCNVPVTKIDDMW